jgi:hypothetical protein
MEPEYFRDILQSELAHVHTKVDSVIHLQTVANSRTSKLETKVEILNEWKSHQTGHEKATNERKDGINWWVVVIISIINILGTVAAQAIWRG